MAVLQFFNVWHLTLSTLRFSVFCLDLQQTRGYLCYITLTGTNSVPKLIHMHGCVYI